MACSWETLGFLFRVVWSRDPLKNTWTVPEQLLLILAPLCKFVLGERDAAGQR